MAISLLAIKVSRDELHADSVLYALSRPHGACPYPVGLWLRTVRVHALLESDRHTEALSAADSLLRSSAVTMRPMDVALVQYYKAETLWHLERYVEAGPLMQAARRYYAGTTDHLKTATIYGGLGYYHRAVGDTLAALCAFEQALATVRLGADYLNMVEVRRKILEGLATLDLNVKAEQFCYQGEIRRRPENDDGHSDLLLIILIIVVSIGVFLLAWSHR